MRRDVPLLVIEDDAIDVKNYIRAFAALRVSNPIHYVTDGEDALALLRREPPFTDASRFPRPSLMLLDLNMPRLSGLSFLAACKADPSLRSIPAVVMTTSDQVSDQRQCYELGAAGFLVKPMAFDAFVECLRRFDQYWTLCEVPTYE